MDVLTVDELSNLLNNGSLTYDNIYNYDLEIPQYFALKHYEKYKHDNLNKAQKLQVLFQDIEVYTYNTGEFKPEKAISPISAITFYSTFEKIYRCNFLIIPANASRLTKEMIPDLQKEFKNELVKYGYMSEDENIIINLYHNNELALIQDTWNQIHELDPSCLSGFNFDKYDIPYTYNRLLNLFDGDNKKVNNILSKVGMVKTRKIDNKIVYNIVDYPILDLRHLYLPRDEGGLIQ